MAISLFGFTIQKESKPELTNQSFVTPVADDGASTVTAGGYFGTYVDIDASTRSESEMISRYREIAKYPDCDNAIEEIVSEAIAAVDDEPLVTINTDKLNLTDNLKKTIREEFNQILSLLEFNDKGQELFRRWYVDGRIYFQKVIDTKAPKKGIQELRYIDPRKIRKVREVKKEKQQNGVDLVTNIDEFFIYNEKGLNYTVGVPASGNNNSGIKISKDSIAFASSGLLDLDRNLVLGLS